MGDVLEIWYVSSEGIWNKMALGSIASTQNAQ